MISLKGKVQKAFNEYATIRFEAYRTREKSIVKKIKNLRNKIDRLSIKLDKLYEEGEKTIEPKLLKKMLRAKAKLLKAESSIPRRKS